MNSITYTKAQEQLLNSKEGADQLRKEIFHLIVLNSGNDPNSVKDVLRNLKGQLKNKRGKGRKIWEKYGKKTNFNY